MCRGMSKDDSGFGPRADNNRKRFYRTYELDKSLPIPRTTAWRRRKLEKEADDALPKQDEIFADNERQQGANEVAMEVEAVEGTASDRTPSPSTTIEEPNDSVYGDGSDDELYLDTPSQTGSNRDSEISDDDSSSSRADTPEDVPQDENQDDGNIFSVLVREGLTVGDIFYMVFCYTTRHNINQSATEDLLKLVNVILGDNILPATKYFFEKFFLEHSPQQIIHLHCAYCGHYLMNIKKEDKSKYVGSCLKCRTEFTSLKFNNGNFHLSISLPEQLEAFFRNKENQRLIKITKEKRQRESEKGVLTDRMSGSIFKTGKIAKFMKNGNNYTLSISYDGAQQHKAGTDSTWPILYKVDQVPSQCHRSILGAIWFGSKPPNIHTLFHSAVTDLQKLYNEGIVWKNAEGEEVLSKFVVSCFVGDIPARAKVLCVTGHMGHFSCIYCFHPGFITEVGKKKNGIVVKSCKQVRYPETEKNFVLRKHSDFLDDAELATVHSDVVRGVKAASPLLLFPLFEIPTNVGIDFMHLVCKGEVRAFLEKITSTVGVPYYVGSPANMARLDDRMKNLKPDSSVMRLPRPISDKRYWKAKEELFFLLLFGPVVLKGILPPPFYQMFVALSEAIYVLLMDKISSHDLNHADKLILEYVCNCKKYFGEVYCVSNNHLLTHLPQDVWRMASLANHSTFDSEGDNGWLLNMVFSPNGVAHQIGKRYLLESSLESFISTNNITLSPDALNYVELCLYKGKRRKHATTVGGVTALGRGKSLFLPGELEAVFTENNIPFFDTCLSFDRLILNGKVYTTSSYAVSKKRNDSYIELNNGCVGVIQQIITFKNDRQSDVYVLFKRVVQEMQVSDLPRHIRKVLFTDEDVTVCKASEVMCKIIMLRVDDNMYLSKQPCSTVFD